MSAATSQHTFAVDLVELLAELEDVKRTQRANMGTYSYTFADLADVESYVRPILARHRFGHVQQLGGEPGSVSVATELVHVSGETKLSPTLSMRAPDNPQQVGSIVTYLRRYSLLASLGLATEDDDGAAGAVQQPQRQQTRAPEATDPTKPTPEQSRKLHAIKDALHMSDRDVWLSWISGTLGREIDSTSDVTRREASLLIEIGEEARKRDVWQSIGAAETAVAQADADEQLDAELLDKAKQRDDEQ